MANSLASGSAGRTWRMRNPRIRSGLSSVRLCALRLCLAALCRWVRACFHRASSLGRPPRLRSSRQLLSWLCGPSARRPCWRPLSLVPLPVGLSLPPIVEHQTFLVFPPDAISVAKALMIGAMTCAWYSTPISRQHDCLLARNAPSSDGSAVASCACATGDRRSCDRCRRLPRPARYCLRIARAGCACRPPRTN